MKLSLNFHLKKNQFHLKSNVDIEWKQPSCHVIFGKSGIGKTHFLRAINGLEKVEGQILWHDKHQTEIWFDSSVKRDTPCHQRHVAMVFQDQQLFSHLTVEDNIKFAFERSNATHHDWQQCIQALQIEPLLGFKTQQLSGGQAQRVALARAILSRPKLLILDEPLASLDWQAKQDVLRYIKQLNQLWKLPILYVTHDVNEVLALADHVIMLEQTQQSTRVRDPRPLIEILQDDDHPFYTLGKSSILNVTNTGVVKEQLVHCQLGNQIIRLPEVSPENTTESTLRLCISASDVSLSLSASQDSSIINILKGKITRIDKTNNHQYMIQVNIEGQMLLSEISAHSYNRLKIELWQTIFVQIKGIALQAAM